MTTLDGAPISDEKLTQLDWVLAQFDSALVAFSGGVDSTLLLLLAQQVLGEHVLAVTVRFTGMPADEADEAARLAKLIGARHRIVELNVLDVPEVAHNDPARCYACKRRIFKELKAVADAEGCGVVLDGAIADDTGDYRPGMRAAQELGVRSPLLEAGVTKQEVRALLRQHGLPNWNKPSTPCLATRFPYGSVITPNRVHQVWVAECFLHELGFGNVRVRHHEEVARIEVPVAQMEEIISAAPRIVQYLKEVAGFRYVTLDLQGFRSGSMNETLSSSVSALEPPA